MWYFTWSLGTLFACSVGLIAAVWLEYNDTEDKN